MINALTRRQRPSQPTEFVGMVEKDSTLNRPRILIGLIHSFMDLLMFLSFGTRTSQVAYTNLNSPVTNR